MDRLTDAVCSRCKGTGDNPELRDVPCSVCDGSGMGNGVRRALERLALYESRMSRWRKLLAALPIEAVAQDYRVSDAVREISSDLEKLRDV